MCKHLLSGFVFVALLLIATNAAALCVQGFNYEVYVGDTASDSACTYNSIQDALSATYTCPTTVRITREHTYTSQHLTINGTSKPLYLQGEADGVTCYQLAHCPPGSLNHCHAATTQPLVTIDGSNTSGSVLTITGNSTVTLRDLTITRGSASAIAGGGGINFDGTGSLYLDTSTVNLSYAGYGGGISIYGNGGVATLTLGANSLVLDNVAQYDGGGIYVTGQARLFALQPQTLIGYNQAPNGHGGGITVIGPARADIGSAGYNGSPVIAYNSAQYGGGIAIDAGSGDPEGQVRLFTVDPNNPVQVSNNNASSKGGAIYAKANTDVYINRADVCAFDYRINNNTASDGAAVYEDNVTLDGDLDVGSALYLNGSYACGPESPPALGSVPCARGVACNEMFGNITENGSAQPTAGAVIAVGSDSYIIADRLIMRRNTAGYAVEIIGQPGPNYGQSTLQDCLVADNHTQHELITMQRSKPETFVIDGCTFANNTIDNGYVLNANGNTELSLFDSIFDVPGVPTVATSPGASLTAVDVLSNDTSTLPVDASIVQGEPTFVNSGVPDYHSADYHLQATSLGVDFAPSGGGVDLDRLPRDVDLAQVPNYQGPRDIGAYERQYVCNADTIFCNGFDTYH